MRTLPILALLALAALAEDDALAKRMDAIRATPAERRWRHVPFERSFVVAMKKAKAVNKPIFYFAADGVLDAGNC